jgi:hypothetical protein
LAGEVEIAFPIVRAWSDDSKKSSQEESRGIFLEVIVIHENKVVKVVKYDVRHVMHEHLIRCSLC